jgi:hypothetical protein
MRWWLALIAILGCKKDAPITDGVSRINVDYRAAGDRGYLDVSFTVRLADAPIVGSSGVALKAACQIGADRIVDDGPPTGKLAQGQPIEFEDHPFITRSGLAESPSLCELELTEVSYQSASRSLGRFCVTDAVKAGPCPPNRPAGTPGPTGVTAALTSVVGEDADELGFPAHLTVRYRVTAHRDMPPNAWLVRETSCGSRSDSTWHSELEHLRAGESFLAAQNTYRSGRPASGTRCTTRFGYASRVNGPTIELATFCHVDDRITPC